jgi:hypothetical protein
MSSEKMAIERTHRYAQEVKARQDFKEAAAARRKLDHDASYTARTTESASAREERHAAYDARCRKAAAKAGAKVVVKTTSAGELRTAEKRLRLFLQEQTTNPVGHRLAIKSATNAAIMGNISAVDFLARNTVPPQNDYEYDVRAQSPNAINWHEVKDLITQLQNGIVSVNEVLTQGFVPKKDIAAVWVYVMSQKYGPDTSMLDSQLVKYTKTYEHTINTEQFPADFFTSSGSKSGHCVIL